MDYRTDGNRVLAWFIYLLATARTNRNSWFVQAAVDLLLYRVSSSKNRDSNLAMTTSWSSLPVRLRLQGRVIAPVAPVS